MNKKVAEKAPREKKTQEAFGCCLQMKEQIDIYNSLFEKLSNKIQHNFSEINELKTRVGVIESNSGLYSRIRNFIRKK